MLNKVELVGTVSKDAEFLFTTKSGNDKYQFYLSCQRNSGTLDILPIITYTDEFKEGDRVKIEGIYTSFNKQEENKNKLKLAVRANKIEQLVLPLDDQNDIKLEGIICKKPILRTTPFGRVIADVLIAVNRNGYNYSDYIPIIFWGKCAEEAEKLEIGDCIRLEGRVQSRPYIKEDVEHVAYEVSASSLEILENIEK